MINNEKIIEIKNLNMSYGSKQVLKNINLDINRGNIIGYIGPNGAGKSTTIKIISEEILRKRILSIKIK